MPSGSTRAWSERHHSKKRWIWPGRGSVHIAGGGEIYRAALPIATHLDLTEIDAAPDGDTFFPDFDQSDWREVASEHHPADDRHAHAFTFRMYERSTASIAD